MKYLLSLCIVLSLFLLRSDVVSAQSKDSGQLLRISPVIVHLPLSPSDTLRYDVTVENLRSVPLPLRLSKSDFSSESEDGGYVFTDSAKNPLLQWMSFSENEFILNAGEKRTITMTVQTPSTIDAGGYYGVVFFEPVLPQSDRQTTVSTRIGMLVLGTLGFSEEQKNAEILTYTLPFVSMPDSLPLTLRVKNTGLNFFTAKPIVTLRPILGHEKKHFIEEKIIFPNTVRRWENKLPIEQTPFGIYNATLSVSTGNGDSITKSQWILILPNVYVSTILIVVFFAVFILLFRRRLKEALKAFVQK